MAYAAHSRSAIQLGREATFGTAVAATEVWRGETAQIKNSQATETIPEEVGTYIGTDRTYIGWKGGELAIPATAMTTEQLPHILEAGILTATATGSGPYVRDYVYPINSKPTIKSYTLQAGNKDVSGDNRILNYAFVSSAKFSGSVKSTWMMESTWMGQQVTTGAMTGALALLDVEEILFANTALTIDASGGTIGTTAISGVMTAAEISISDTGIREVPTADGSSYFTQHKMTRPSVDFSITMELEDSEDAVETARAAHDNNTPQLIQMTATGSSGRVR